MSGLLLPSEVDRTYTDGAAQGLDYGRLQNEDGLEDRTGLVNPLWTPDGDRPDPNRSQEFVPEFADHPIPRVAQTLWLLARWAGSAPPWYVRVAPSFAATYTLRRIALALQPHAVVVVDRQNRLVPPPTPAYDIEYVITDQPRRVEDAPIGGRIVTPDQAWKR